MGLVLVYFAFRSTRYVPVASIEEAEQMLRDKPLPPNENAELWEIGENPKFLFEANEAGNGFERRRKNGKADCR